MTVTPPLIRDVAEPVTDGSEPDLLLSGANLTDAFCQLSWEGLSSHFCFDFFVQAHLNVDRVFDAVTRE